MINDEEHKWTAWKSEKEMKSVVALLFSTFHGLHNQEDDEKPGLNVS